VRSSVSRELGWVVVTLRCANDLTK
jgi:hypothetical protein